jgi:8-oxo-dGTP pyrophosphatase MutT (NUDIX family)
MEARTAQSRVLAFAQKAFITKNGKLLVIRRAASDPVNPLRWEVPGGRIEPGELLDDCIRREVREEVGLEIVPGSPFFLWQWSVPLSSDGSSLMDVVAVARICTCSDTTTTLRNQQPDDHIDGVEWVDFGKLTGYDFIPNMAPVLAAFLNVAKPDQSMRMAPCDS